ncbi:D-alanyl-D-alanine carboxypeptidase family protein [Paenibacillus sp. J2TS4]|uniref:D-alanyl-D-alanine carboxypeptidase family protein n=1 Tax=Paenibacillus sp. J2TS4 TaxID=2807194 RepID=UPI001AFFA2BD|nr:D-alanyl-D-alanine carboxypeptidase family protein [Paenibacillus sp. J2TS4]GIP33952.1 hypothetical protein J2TS4_31620 [Paenibacillus sp. J2TS4]
MKRKFFLFLFALAIVLVANAVGKDGWVRLWNQVKVQTNDRDFAMKEIQGEAAILMDQRTGKILFYKNDKERMYPASTTKILTALLALELGDMDEIVEVGEEAKPHPGESKAGLVQGQRLPLRDLLHALMLPSGNDAARTIAIHIAARTSGRTDMEASEATSYFAGLMNDRARRVGAKHSHFVNPHGLHDDNHYTTARDMMLIASEAMKNEDFRSIVSTEMYTSHSKGQPETLSFTNTNQLLQKNSGNYFEGADGIKTGFTDEAGYCLVSSATRYNAGLIAVVLKSTNDRVWLDSSQLLEYGFKALTH